MTARASFWDRRRAGVRAEAEAEARVQENARVTALQAEMAEKGDDAILEEMGLPDPDKMESGDDFAAFMAQEVPTHLRNKALRKLWRSNPVLACVDGLNEYDDDFRAAMLSGGPIQTAYQVGKGMMSHLEKMAEQEERKEALAQADQIDEAVPEDEAPVVEIVDEPFTDPEELVTADAPTEEPRMRRMRFDFEDAGV
ncbi:DUF3306 domain-containing protein [uncultured Roseobacter sp.]|uniref:DUF3306 domain-containing protein n=1 Tax=uncultured Roseobacter sp. TaxID=114847 RepID=UPI0026161873|nr:DUF3306 domain-containing protein [uncultured Roseobacter sp.]